MKVNKRRQFVAWMFLILISASPSFSLSGQDDKAAGGALDYKNVNGFSGVLTLDDDPREKIRIFLGPEEIVTLRAMPVMVRGETMGAFVELRGCKPNARGVCNARVNYKIYRPDGSVLATRVVRQTGILWKKPRDPKGRNSSKKRRREVQDLVAAKQSNGLARMHFRLGRNDPAGAYSVKATVTDLNAEISFELARSFDLK